MNDVNPVDEIVLPALLGWPRPYGGAIRKALAEAGFDDMPRRGAFVVGGIARNGAVGQQVLEADLGVSKQAASQLIDALVVRGYVERRPDDGDRRRMHHHPHTPRRGRRRRVHAAVDRVDALLAADVGPADIATVRRVPGRLADIDPVTAQAP